MPDINASNSKPVKLLFNVLAVMGVASVLQVYNDAYESYQLLLVVAGTYLFIRYVVFGLFNRLTLHRGVFHSLLAALCLNSLQMAFWRRKQDPGLLHHSDRGSQYASKEYREHLGIMKMQQSMSRKGKCWGNASAERFFRSLKHEQINYERFTARLSIIDYLALYNSKRMHSKFRLSSPARI